MKNSFPQISYFGYKWGISLNLHVFLAIEEVLLYFGLFIITIIIMIDLFASRKSGHVSR